MEKNTKEKGKRHHSPERVPKIPDRYTDFAMHAGKAELRLQQCTCHKAKNFNRHETEKCIMTTVCTVGLFTINRHSIFQRAENF